MLHTNYANKFLNLITAQVDTLHGTGKCYIGFSSTAPNLAGENFTEPTSKSYARIQVAVTDALQYTDKMGGIDSDGNATAQAYGGAITNTSAFSSEQCLEEEGWPEFTHFGIFDTKTGGMPIASDVLRDPDGEPDENGLYPESTLKVEHRQVAVFKVGALQLTLK